MTGLAAERNNETPAQQFLLGKLSGEDRSRFEEGFLADGEAFEEIEVAEDELVDAYVRDELSARDRNYLEKHLLTVPRIAKRVKVAHLLNTSFVPDPAISRTVAKSATSRSWWSSWIPAKSAWAPALSLLLVLGGAILLVQYFRVREQSIRLQAERAALERQVRELTTQNIERSSEREQLNAQLELQRAENARLNEAVERQLDRPAQPAAIIPLTLFSGGSRSAGAADSLKLPTTPAKFQFNLLLEADEFPTYKAVVTTLSGREMGQRSQLKARRKNNTKVVTFNLSSTRFTPGDYVVTLSGASASGHSEPIASYNFRVLSKARPEE